MDLREIRYRLELVARHNGAKPHAILLTREQMASLKEHIGGHTNDPFNDIIEVFGVRVLTEDKILRI